MPVLAYPVLSYAVLVALYPERAYLLRVREAVRIPAIVLRTRYAMAVSRARRYHAPRRPVLRAGMLLPGAGMRKEALSNSLSLSGFSVPKHGTVLRARYAMSGTDLAYGLRACYAMPGTGLAYLPTRSLSAVQYLSSRMQARKTAPVQRTSRMSIPSAAYRPTAR
eukprot:1372005-Rhodomonas_salina.5